jgi:hypothetical protein
VRLRRGRSTSEAYVVMTTRDRTLDTSLKVLSENDLVTRWFDTALNADFEVSRTDSVPDLARAGQQFFN